MDALIIGNYVVEKGGLVNARGDFSLTCQLRRCLTFDLPY
jgi:hypothetical protein